uniref:Uncharacterized protein n=1 Tax=Steinernema glaseri TaxID=37863 RepID=A0A1I7Z123_9BILA
MLLFVTNSSTHMSADREKCSDMKSEGLWNTAKT